MKTADFEFDLPEELIARMPLARRADSRLLHILRNTQQISDRAFTDILDLIKPGDLLVFNDTRVIPARLFGQKETGGAVEVLVERVVDDHNVLAHVRSSKSPKPGRKLILENEINVTVTGRQGDLFELKFDSDTPVLEQLERYGRIPLPPYIEREADLHDSERYQTVYAKHPGAVAAPTAGLHFDEAVMQTLQKKGVDVAYVTLHVGAGTFQPVRVDDIHDHVMHAERVTVEPSVVEKINSTKQAGGRVIAVGTTVVRCLETAASSGELKPYQGETSIFIYPGYQFKVIDALFTNFHLPGSTLIMLVSAFAGRELVLKAYQHAIEEKYRFYSYGDAMFIE